MSDLLTASPEYDLHDIEQEEHWISVSDLMAGLMMVFLFISIALMVDANKVKEKATKVAKTYQETQVAIYKALMEEFEDDLPLWKAEIQKDTLSFEFKSPDVLFDTGENTLKPSFEDILHNFAPRYLGVLLKFRKDIEEVRIEGHTSSVWNTETDEVAAYFKNMRLSQGRTRSVLEYIYGLDSILHERAWVKKHIAAVGFSSSKAVLYDDGTENRDRSRRVTFRTITNADTQIRTILAQVVEP